MSSDGEITEFIPFTPKNPDTLPSSSATFTSIISTLKSFPGILAVHHGARFEDPSQHLLVVRWASHADIVARTASEDYTQWMAEFRTVASRATFYESYLVGSSGTTATTTSPAASVLDAPCTEVLVAYGIEKPAFVDNLRTFSDKMAGRGAAGEMKGWHANAWGEVTGSISNDEGGGVSDEPGPAALLLVGWDSMEDHLQAKSRPGPILDNIELIRNARESMAMYHVPLQKL